MKQKMFMQFITYFLYHVYTTKESSRVKCDSNLIKHFRRPSIYVGFQPKCVSSFYKRKL